MAHIIFKASLVVFEIGAAAPKNNEKNMETSPLGVPLAVAACGKLAKQNQGITLKQMHERAPEESIQAEER